MAISDNVYESPSADLQGFDDDAVAISNKDLFFSFKGRINRGKYWFATLMIFVSFIGLGVVIGVLGLSEETSSTLILLFYIPVIWVSLAVQIKRWHDRNKSGWWILINLVPIIGGLWAFIENGLLSGDYSSNNYGPPCA